MNQNTSVGAKIKALRINKKYTLKDLSALSGLSTGFLSQLERGVSSIAIDSLAKIADILGVSLSSFFEDNYTDNESMVCRRYESKFTQISPQVLQYILSKNEKKYDMMPRIFELMPITNTDKPEMYNHIGEEFIYVLEGVITVFVDNNEYELYPGDSMQIDSTLPHNWINKTNNVVKILSINTPNPFKYPHENYEQQ